VFDPFDKPEAGWRRDLYTVIYETDTPLGWAFDAALLAAILLSVLAVALETVQPLGTDYAQTFYVIEIALTALFTVEYVLRLIVIQHPSRYALSFFGIVDLLAVLPTYLAFFLVDASSLQTVRILRLLRVFRVLKLGKFLREGTVLVRAIKASRYKISVFLFGVLILVVIQGSLVYAVEGDPNGQFSSLPKSIYWAIITLTTVGYGDIAPQTALGQSIAAIIMLMGYGIIAVPTGIVSVEVARATDEDEREHAGDSGKSSSPNWSSALMRPCEECKFEELDPGANFCRACGAKLPGLHFVDGG
jgi:voltage-gated potassium channel